MGIPDSPNVSGAGGRGPLKVRSLYVDNFVKLYPQQTFDWRETKYQKPQKIMTLIGMNRQRNLSNIRRQTACTMYGQPEDAVRFMNRAVSIQMSVFVTLKIISLNNFDDIYYVESNCEPSWSVTASIKMATSPPKHGLQEA